MRILINCQCEPRDGFIDEKIAKFLRSMGHTVIVKSFVLDGRKAVTDFKPDLVVIPEARCEYAKDYAADLKEMGVLVVIRRTEPGYCREDTRSDTHKQFCIGNWKYDVDLEITWGQEFADIVRENDNAVCKNVVACGGFSFDSYFPVPARDKPERPVACWATIWDYADRTPEYCVPELPYGHPYHVDAFKKCRAGRDKWLNEMVRVFNKYHEKWDMFVKVHPSEQFEEYVNRVGKHIQIINQPKAVEALQKTSLLIHAGSTMAIEAHLMNIPSIQFCRLSDTMVDKISPHVDKVELDDIDLTKSNADVSVINHLEKTVYGTIDGKASHRAAREIDKLTPRKTNIPDRWPQNKRNYYIPGVTKTLSFDDGRRTAVQCVACKNMFYMPLWMVYTKCPHCALGLRRGENG